MLLGLVAELEVKLGLRTSLILGAELLFAMALYSIRVASLALKLDAMELINLRYKLNLRLAVCLA